jgi:DNA-binding response OmpR family regulator
MAFELHSGNTCEQVCEVDEGTSMARLLLVADRSGEELSELLGDTLRTVEGVIESYADTQRNMQRNAAAQPDLILVDLSLPDEKSFKICRDLYYRGVRAPILMWNRAKTDVEELVSSVRLLLTRSLDGRSAPLPEFVFGAIRVEFTSGTVTRGGTPVKLSSKEFHLLRYLISWRGTVISRSELLAGVWRYKATTTRTLDVHIASLRQKIEECPHRPSHILTVRRAGYMFQEPKTTSPAT